MCGISGILAKNISFNIEDLVFQMIGPIAHRGPDDKGVWVSNVCNVGLGHRRLSILDLSSNGHQPMCSKSKRFVIVYNGEIYNHLQVRKIIEEKRNIIWRSNSDTETILECFEEFGFEKSLELFEGMFSIALWDSYEKRLYLARDRFGEKPLYYGFSSEECNSFIFGSDLSSFKNLPIFNQLISRDSLALFFRFNYIPAPYTIFKNIYKLNPGHYIEFNFNSFDYSLKCYWKADDIARNSSRNITSLSFQESSIELENLLLKVVKSQMISDVPLGSFLSGGIDSSLITALMQASSSIPIKTFTIGFSENQFDESIYAEKIAKVLGTDHTSHIVSANEAMNLIPLIQDAYSEPFADSSQIPTMLVSKLAKSKVTVSLSGDAGDEIFGGYNRYFKATSIYNKTNIIPYFLKSFSSELLTNNQIAAILSKFSNNYITEDKIQKVSKILKSQTLDDVYMNLISHFITPSSFIIDSEEPKTYLNGLQSKFDFSDFRGVESMMIKDTLTYLPDDILVKVDRAAMFYSLETRVPFLNHKVFEYAWSLPINYKVNSKGGKLILKDILSRYVPKENFDRPKMGFGIPIDNWLKGPLRNWMIDLLSYDMVKKYNILNPEMVQVILKNYLTNKSGSGYQLWNFIVLQSWLNKNFK